MEAERKNSPTLSKSKQPVKTEWGSQSVVFTYFQGDLNSVIDEHFSRALSNAKNPQDLSTKHKSEDVILKNGEQFSMSVFFNAMLLFNSLESYAGTFRHRGPNYHI